MFNSLFIGIGCNEEVFFDWFYTLLWDLPNQRIGAGK